MQVNVDSSSKDSPTQASVCISGVLVQILLSIVMSISKVLQMWFIIVSNAT